ncbi:MAG: hypothetical protein LBQ14_10670 [Treponema sp.]|nr:hypothetical protein [Treponema sp.]
MSFSNNSENAYHVVLGVNIAAGSGTVLDGFTISGAASGTAHITVGSKSIPQWYGGGMYNNTSSPGIKIRNSIIWGNTATINGSNIYNAGSRKPDISCSIAEGSGGSDSWDPAAGNDGGGNLDADPVFAGTGDYRLGTGSPAINAGDNVCYAPEEHPNLSAVTADLDGDSRIQGWRVDMGAYEKE